MAGRTEGVGAAVRLALTLEDRQEHRKWQRAAVLDAPALVAPRAALLALLGDARVVVPGAQRAAMSWPEALPLAALALLGRGALEYEATKALGSEHPTYGAASLAQ